MNDREALLQTILANPADDACRLVYADWLRENGEWDRAEFIAVQIELARPLECEWMTRGMHCERYNQDVQPYRVMAQCPTCRRIDALRARERELCHSNRQWHEDFFAAIGHVGSYIAGACDSPSARMMFEAGYRFGIEATFRRGFVEIITCTFSNWLTHHAAIQAATPLRKCRLTTRPEVGRGAATDRTMLVSIGATGGQGPFPRMPVFATDDQIIEACCAMYWPGIKFELPPANPLAAAPQF